MCIILEKKKKKEGDAQKVAPEALSIPKVGRKRETLRNQIPLRSEEGCVGGTRTGVRDCKTFATRQRARYIV